MDFIDEPAAEQPENTQPANEPSAHPAPAPDALGDALAMVLKAAKSAKQQNDKKQGKEPAPKQQPRVAIQEWMATKYSFRKDVGSGKRYVAPAGMASPFSFKPFTLTDDTVNGICLELAQDKVANSRPFVEQVICTPQVSLPINLPQEQLDYLEQHWDGQDRVSELVACCTTDNPVLFAVMFVKWLVSVVAQVFDVRRRNEYAFVFVGEQGCGKTGFFERLLWGQSHYVAPATAFNFGNKEHLLLMTSHVLILLDEMSAYGRKTDLDQLKAAFSQTNITTDKKYQEANTYPRRGSFAGTTNKQDFLRDATGDRRFLVFELAKYDQDRFNAIDKRQLWGQLTRMYKQGFVTRLTSAEIAANMARNTESFSLEKAEEYFIEQHFVVTGNEKHFVPSKTMYLLIDEFNKGLSGKTFGLNSSTVSALLRRMGVLCSQQQRIQGVNYKGFRGLQLRGDWESDNPVNHKAITETVEHMRPYVQEEPPAPPTSPEEAAAQAQAYDEQERARQAAYNAIQRDKKERWQAEGCPPDPFAKFTGEHDDRFDLLGDPNLDEL